MSALRRRPKSEEEVSALVVDWLRGSKNAALLACEIRSHGRARTDILMLWGGELSGVEVKLSDWRRALAQAVLNRYCVDRSYIAMWGSVISENVVREAHRHGVGVISVTDDEIVIVSDAPRTDPLSSLRGDILSRAFGEVG